MRYSTADAMLVLIVMDLDRVFAHAKFSNVALKASLSRVACNLQLGRKSFASLESLGYCIFSIKVLKWVCGHCRVVIHTT